MDPATTSKGKVAKSLASCYLLSHGFSARMVLHSDLPSQLATNEVDLISYFPEAKELAFEQFASHTKLVQADFTESKWTHTQLTELRRYLREPLRDNAALWSRHLHYVNSPRKALRWRASLMSGVHRVSYPSHVAQSAIRGIDRRLHRSTSVRRQLEEMRPTAVVSTYPVSPFESTVLTEARSLGIPTIGHLLSWDNITCKGRFITVPDYFISWGPIMTSELKEFYGIDDSRVYDCGVPHFDAHLNLVDHDVRKETLQNLNIDPSRPYLFFGMSAPIFAPREIDIVEWLARQVEQDRFGAEMQLVVRPHPQNVTGFTADASWLPRLNAIKSRRVGLNMPKLEQSSTLSWNMATDDLAKLVNLLHGCSVSLNSGSTLSIDALVHGKPVVLTFFDAEEELPWWQSARRIAEFPHYKTLLDTGALARANSFAKLATAIDRYIENPHLHSELRANALKLECGAPDGKASSRVADAIHTICSLANSRN